MSTWPNSLSAKAAVFSAATSAITSCSKGVINSPHTLRQFGGQIAPSRDADDVRALGHLPA
ncbi:hypothetical protein [Bradyrhizobium liaoningense]|uniref:hypothetical protein n=1 Tax=Bradyrhizobium liaoningense TaxID=43992 RepID=UPI0005536D2D|nr:hypothetical protein [Bradyrhizobium liaoningense]GLR98232.1 hypothetical protein GCM10007858_58740 [Bradyrhizobium liaoningense]